MHKSNSTFFSDIDIARSHLMITLFRPLIRKPPASLTDGRARDGILTVVLAGVACAFKREIKPYERYEIWSRMLCWDEKWVYFVSHFVKAGKVKKGKNGGWLLQSWRSGVEEENEDCGRSAEILAPSEKAILASAVSKCVFRQKREFVVPGKVFEAAGLLPGAVGKSEDGTPPKEQQWKADRIEAERIKGLKVAEAMAGLNLAHGAFEPDSGPVLAEYRDIWALA